MKIRIETEIYEGSPAEIIEQLWEGSFDREQFPDLEGYIKYMAESFERFTDMPCAVPDGDIHARAHALILNLAEIDALEVLEDE